MKEYSLCADELGDYVMMENSGGTKYVKLEDHVATLAKVNARLEVAVEQIEIADKLIRFESDEPQWVTMMKVLDVLQKALAKLKEME